ncbi:hypothetical protein J4220_00690 [Candidatus Micrarchaeota archaeon]|nr:hypothetical protein [Candidatus Micrarchaeota archaeon]
MHSGKLKLRRSAKQKLKARGKRTEKDYRLEKGKQKRWAREKENPMERGSGLPTGSLKGKRWAKVKGYRLVKEKLREKENLTEKGWGKEMERGLEKEKRWGKVKLRERDWAKERRNSLTESCKNALG